MFRTCSRKTSRLSRSSPLSRSFSKFLNQQCPFVVAHRVHASPFDEAKEGPIPFTMYNGKDKCTWKVSGSSEATPHVPIDRAGLGMGTAGGKIVESVLDLVGNTPMVRLNRMMKKHDLKCDLVAKCEFYSAGGSVKDRIGLRMLEEAEMTGLCKPGDTIIEPTSGNTGIGLCLAGAVKGYNVIITLPQKMSGEKVNTMKALGAEILRTPTSAAWNDKESHIALALRIQQQLENSHVLDQYKNPSNPLAHYENTAEEIIEQCRGKVDYLFLTAGTGGTLTGIARKFREKMPDCKIVGVDPRGSILAEPENMNEQGLGVPYHVEGIGYDFVPTVLDRDVVDVWMKSEDKASFDAAREVISTEGVLCGGSSGSVMAAALDYIKSNNIGEGKRVCVLLPDSIRNYMSKFLDDGWMINEGFKQGDYGECTKEPKTGTWVEGELGFTTTAVHGGVKPNEETGAILTPVNLSTTFVQDSIEQYLGKGYSYSRSGNPTVTALEHKIAAMEKGYGATAVSTGMAATTVVISGFMEKGDHCVITDCSYGGTNRICREHFTTMGMEFDFVDFSNMDNIRNAIKPNTKLIFSESPTNPTLQIADVEAISNLADEHGIIHVCDSTFATPVIMRPLDHGAHLVIQSLTKYYEGHNMGVGGAIIAKTKELDDRVHYVRNMHGNIMHPLAAFLCAQTAKTMELRVKKQSENAMAIAKWLETHPKVTKVVYPGLNSFPQKVLADKYHRNGIHGGMLWFDVVGGDVAATQLMNTVERPWSLCENLGATESIITACAVMTHANMIKEDRLKVGISDGFIRISCGIEDTRDLIRALKNSLDRL